MNKIWHFPITDGGDDDGINDAGVEQFNGNKERSIARECIQNSLDARKDYTKPVRVEFSAFQIDKNAIPGHEDLYKIIQKAKEYSQGDETAEAFYDKATSCFNTQKINVLKISDYNTVGLSGGDSKKDNPGGWYALARSNGSSYKAIDSGGSFGIGKSAPFVASAIRTVFYSTRLENGDVAFQGKTRLSSFEGAFGEIHHGTGQYGFKKESGHGVDAIREYNAIPDLFKRPEQGTDIFIIGYQQTEDWKKRIVESIVESFYVAINENALEVSIKTEGEEIFINTQTLPEIINQFVTDEDTILFYKTLVDEKHRLFVDDIDQLGQVKMYVRLGEGKRHVQGMRKTLMKIHDFARLRTLNDEYTGIVIVTGDDGNKLLRGLEPPAHDEWDKNRGDDESKEALSKLRDWVVSNLRKIANSTKTDVEEIPELSKYLPQDIVDDDRDPIFAPSGQNAKGDSNNETATEHSMSQEQKSKVSLNIKNRKANITKPGTSGGVNNKVPRHTGGKTGKKGPGGADEPEGNTRYADPNDMEIKVKETFLDGKREYIFTIVPSKDDAGDIRIIGYGEGEVFPLDISNAYLLNGTRLATEKENIKDLVFVANQPIGIRVELKSSRRYIIGVA